MSRPQTPPTVAPEEESQFRFHELTTPTEWAEDYRPGKYHPVNLGDTFKDSTYRVIRKLGYGSYSTVWLAKDQATNKYVALKISIANQDRTHHELDISRTLSQVPPGHPGKQFIPSLLDVFTHDGPNGSHLCLVHEVLGPGAADIPESISSLIPGSRRGRRYSLSAAKAILYQTLLYVDFLQQNYIVHADLHPGNLLFSISDLNHVDEKNLAQDESDGDVCEPLRRIDGLVDLWAPKFLIIQQPLTDYIDTTDLKIKVSDLGGGIFPFYVLLALLIMNFIAAFPFSNPPSNPVTPVGLRSPQLVFKNQIPTDQDIWSFGCLIFELITGSPLFVIAGVDDDDDLKETCFSVFREILGPLPEHFLACLPRPHLYSNEKGYTGPLPPGVDPSDYPPFPPLEELFDKNKPEEMNDQEAGFVKTLLRWTLQYEQEDRPSASDLLRHPWFATMEELSWALEIQMPHYSGFACDKAPPQQVLRAATFSHGSH
ncbi:kinase-like domain-containing protein [Aspergillus californicus]